jgi:phosphoglucomutase
MLVDALIAYYRPLIKPKANIIKAENITQYAMDATQLTLLMTNTGLDQLNRFSHSVDYNDKEGAALGNVISPVVTKINRRIADIQHNNAIKNDEMEQMRMQRFGGDTWGKSDFAQKKAQQDDMWAQAEAERAAQQSEVDPEVARADKEAMVKRVMTTPQGRKEVGANVGVANDGDADRCLIVDEKGEVLDGDQIMLLCALELMEQGKLNDNMLVTTVMSNVGLHKAMKDAGGKTVKTGVGDRYVLEEMLKHDYSLGGEQSGHIIFSEFAKTGDGILTAVQVLCSMVKNNKTLSEMGAVMTKFPQILLNVRVGDKNGWEENQAIKDVIKKYQDELGDNGQILVRASGTEPLIRIMAEGPKQEYLEQIAEAIAEVVAAELA